MNNDISKPIKNKNNRKLFKTNTKQRICCCMFFLLIVLALSGCSSESVSNDSSEVNNNTTTSIDISELVGQPLDVAVEKFGEYTISHNKIGKQILKFSDGLIMTSRNKLIGSVTVDCSEITDKTKYNYKGIDGNSTQDDVIKILGEPEDLRFTSDTYKRYPIDDYEFKVTYSEDGLVIEYTFEMK